MLPMHISTPYVVYVGMDAQTVQFCSLNQHSWIKGALMFGDNHDTLGEETMIDITKYETSNNNNHDEENEILWHL